MTVANQSTIDKTLEIHSINNRNKIITLIITLTNPESYSNISRIIR